MEHFKRELIDDLDYYNNRRSKAKLKGLPLLFTDSKPFRLLDSNICLTFWGHFTFLYEKIGFLFAREKAFCARETDCSLIIAT